MTTNPASTAKGKIISTTSTKPTPKQLDWFNFETKIRGVISEIMEPILSRELQDRQNIVLLRKNTENHKKRIEDLEYSLNKSKKKETLFDQIQKKIAENESQRKISQAKLQQDIANTNSNITLMNEKDSILREEFSSYQKQLQFQMNQITRANDHLLEYKTVISQRFAAMASDFASQFQDIKVDNMERDNKVTLNQVMLMSHSDALKQYQQDIEQHTYKIQNLQQFTAELQACKVDMQKYQNEMTIVKNQITGNRYSIQDLSNRLKETDNYIQKYMPIKIQNHISQTMHKCLAYQEEIRLCNYEEDKFAELREIVLKDNGNPTLEKKKYIIPQIVRPARPSSSHRKSGASRKTLTKRVLGSNASLVSGGGGAAAAGAETSSIQGGANKKSGTSTANKMKKKAPQHSESKQTLHSGTVALSTQKLQQVTSNESLTIISPPPQNATTNKVNSSMQSGVGGGGVDLSGAIMSSAEYSVQKTVLIQNQGSPDKKAHLYLQQNNASSLDIEVSKQGYSAMTESQNQEQQEQQQQEESGEAAAGGENLEQVDEQDQSYGDRGAYINQAMIQDILNKAQEKASTLIQEAINNAFTQRDYDFKIETVTKKIEDSINQLRGQLNTQALQREKSTKSQLDQISYFAKTLQTDIQEETKRRKRDKSDLMIQINDFQKQMNQNIKDIQEIKQFSRGVSQVIQVIVEITQIQFSLEAQDEEDRKSIALMGVKQGSGGGGGIQQPGRNSILGATSQSGQRVSTTIPVTRRDIKTKSGTIENTQGKQQQQGSPDAFPQIPNQHARASSTLMEQQQSSNNNNKFSPKNMLRPTTASPLQYYTPKQPNKPVINMDRQALAASGNANFMNQMFKLACLAYLPTPIIYRGKKYTRQELIFLRGKMLQNVWKSVQIHNFSWSAPKIQRTAFDQMLRSEAQGSGGLARIIDSPAPLTNTNYAADLRSMSPQSPPTGVNAKFDAFSLSSTSAGGIDGYIATAIAKKISKNNTRGNIIKDRTSLLMAPNKGNLIGQMSMRRLKAQVKQRNDKRAPASLGGAQQFKNSNIRSISIGINQQDGFQSFVSGNIPFYTNKASGGEELLNTSLNLGQIRKSHNNNTKIQGSQERLQQPLGSKQSSNNGLAYVPQSTLDPRYHKSGNRLNTATPGTRKKVIM